MSRFFRSVAVAVAVAGIALTTLVAPAAAVDPVAGARYKGHLLPTWTETTAVRFKVSKSGNWVTGMYVGPYPVSNCGGGGDAPAQSTSKAAVTNGSFKAHVTYRSDTGKLLAKATVKGTFSKHGREQGTVQSTIFDDASCSSGVYKYATKRQ